MHYLINNNRQLLRAPVEDVLWFTPSIHVTPGNNFSWLNSRRESIMSTRVSWFLTDELVDNNRQLKKLDYMEIVGHNEKSPIHCRHFFPVFLAFCFAFQSFPFHIYTATQASLHSNMVTQQRSIDFVFHFQIQPEHFDSICLVAQGNPPNKGSPRLFMF